VWTRAHGIAVSDRGRIPASVAEQYQAAGKTPDLAWYAAESSQFCLRRPRRLRRPETAYDPCSRTRGRATYPPSCR
jgi:hypothetical protein